jgi:DNA polymerase III gamma/tau subunit
VAKAEGYTLEDGVSELVATFGDGSFRDAYGSLQKIIGISKDKKISLTEAEAITGAPRDSLIMDIVEALSKKDKEKGMKALREVISQNVDQSTLLDLVLERVRFVLLLSFDPASLDFIKLEVSDTTLAKIQSLASDSSKHINSKTLLRLLDAHTDLARSPIPELALELALVDLL